MGPERQCAKCRRKIPWGQVECPFCPGHRGGYFWSLRRDTFLFLTIVALVILFIVTGFAARHYHQVEKGYAQEWYSRGESDLRAGRAGAALTDFRTALSYSRENDQYKLRLAQALMMPGIPRGTGSEARIYLLDLLERQPGSGIVNLQLARLATHDGAVPDALRFYHGAIYGEWSSDSDVQRRSARLELVEFLLQAGQDDAARSELIALVADLPPEPPLQTRVGILLLRAKGYDDALKLFHLALLEQPQSPGALAGAGECHFQLGNYTQAKLFLSRALDLDPGLSRAAATLATVQHVLDNDPFTHDLTKLERARRAMVDFNAGLARLQSCAAKGRIDYNVSGGDPLQILYARAAGLQPRAQPLELSRDLELLSQVMDVTFDIEHATARSCGEPEGLDKALLLMAREQGGIHP